MPLVPKEQEADYRILADSIPRTENRGIQDGTQDKGED